MTEIKICWAYNREGQRCDHPAGHSGNHVVMKEWTDDECLGPGQVLASLSTPSIGSVPARQQDVIAPPLSVVPTPEPANDKCVACNHKHRGVECRCGCYEFIG